MAMKQFQGKAPGNMPKWWKTTTLRIFGEKCVYCDTTGVPITWDHCIPKKDGGGSGVANAVPACYSCNNRKGHKSLHEFVPDETRRAWIRRELGYISLAYNCEAY